MTPTITAGRRYQGVGGGLDSDKAHFSSWVHGVPDKRRLTHHLRPEALNHTCL